MANILKVTQPRLAYIPWLQTLQDFGDPVEVRGRKTLEVLDAVTEVTEPWHHCILLPSRRWNPWLALSEALWILAGRNDVAALAPYNSHISDYSDNGHTLYGAYGARLYGQIDDLVGRLRKDPSDRRAVLSIWNSRGGKSPEYDYVRDDLTVNSKDPPCNNLIYFKLRQNKLHMTVMCRSNDLHWGLFAVNLPTFGILQSYIAARLGVEMGTQTHLSNSLHIYTDEPRAVAITERMLYIEKEGFLKYPEHELVFRPKQFREYAKHQEIAEQCSEILDGNLPKVTNGFLNFAWYFLKAYREKDLGIITETPFRDLHQDWILAGQIFVDKMWK